MVATGLFVVTPPANAQIAYPLGIIYADSAYRNGHFLTWINPNVCLYGAGNYYNWNASDSPGVPGNGAIGQEFFSVAWGQAMSSIYNEAHGCNRVWLMSGPWQGPANSEHLWTGCVRYGQGIGIFGSPWNDNVRGVSFSNDPACGPNP
jgi:hypothetical protein